MDVLELDAFLSDAGATVFWEDAPVDGGGVSGTVDDGPDAYPGGNGPGDAVAGPPGDGGFLSNDTKF